MRQHGVTLLEVLVVLSVAAILAAVGIPSLAGLHRSSGLCNAANGMLASLHLARAEAIKRNARVVLCPSSTGTACATSGGWNQGWLVFHDANNNVAREADETVILSKPALPLGYRLTASGVAAHYLSYAPTGGMKRPSGFLQSATLTLCHESGPLAASRKITINVTGRPHSETVMQAACP